MRKISKLEGLYLFLQGEILLFLLFHDWIPLGSLNDVKAVHSYYTRDELIRTTLINSVPFAIAFALSCIRFGKAYPLWMRLFLIIYFPSLFSGALLAWWIPYFFGAAADRVARYEVLFGGTHAFLPEMNGIVPNTIHTVFHVSLLIVIGITIHYFFAKSPRRAEPKTDSPQKRASAF